MATSTRAVSEVCEAVMIVFFLVRWQIEGELPQHRLDGGGV